MKLIFKTILIVALLQSSVLVEARKLKFNAEVLGTLVQDGAFGDCMVKISPSPDALGLACSADYVTLSCSGDLNSKANANAKLASAQLALVTNTYLTVLVVDGRLHNGYCFADRVENTNTSVP